MNLETVVSSDNCGYNFWKNPEIVANYAGGGNETQKRRFFQAADWLRENPFNKEYLVDIGAGTGEITLLLAMCNASGRNLGVDYSKAMVNVAQEKVRLARLSNVQIWNSDAMALDLPTCRETVTRIVSFSAIHWFPYLDKFISGVDHYLAPGGKCFFRYAGCEGDETLNIAEEMRKEDKWEDKFDGFFCPMYTHHPETMRDEIQKVGMKCEKYIFRINTEEFVDQKDYSKYVSGWLPHYYHITDRDERNAFLAELVEEHCSRDDRHNENGYITVEDSQVEIWASKPKEQDRMGFKKK